jgi:hypothetical protein
MNTNQIRVIPVLAMMTAIVWAALAAQSQIVLSPYPLPAEQVAYNWQADAGQVFGLLPAQVEQMTAQEWGEHQKKMWVMLPEEQAKYREVVRTNIADRIRG